MEVADDFSKRSFCGGREVGGGVSAVRRGRAVETKKPKEDGSTQAQLAGLLRGQNSGEKACRPAAPGSERKCSEFPPPGALHYHSPWSLPLAYKGR